MRRDGHTAGRCGAGGAAELPLAALLGVPGAWPDLNLWAAGLHEMGPGDFLSCHLDGDTGRVMKARRAPSAVLYLDAWRAGWGGELELWDVKREAPAVRVAPAEGRVVALAATDTAYHSVAPVTCPEGARRRTLALFWWGPEAGPGLRPRARFVHSGGGLPGPEIEALRQARAG